MLVKSYNVLAAVGKEPIPVPEWTLSLKVAVDGAKETGKFQKMES